MFLNIELGLLICVCDFNFLFSVQANSKQQQVVSSYYLHSYQPSAKGRFYLPTLKLPWIRRFLNSSGH